MNETNRDVIYSEAASFVKKDWGDIVFGIKNC
jgi:hypothetical protein